MHGKYKFVAEHNLKQFPNKTKEEVENMIKAQGLEPRYSGRLRKWFIYKLINVNHEQKQ